MKTTCLQCERTTPDANLYCQETYCPAELSPTVLDYGEYLGDIEIIKPIITLRSATLYEALHQDQAVFLKIAHPGETHQARLKREALFLRDIAHEGNTLLPTLRPPYINTTIHADPYGRAMLRGQLYVFCLFNYVEGDPLRDVLMKNPQLWINHVGWITLGLTYALAYLHSKGMLHFGLSPESFLVRFDKEQPKTPRIKLIDLGIISDAQTMATNWYADFTQPAYLAPELIDTRPTKPDYATDVYGIGTTLYELLVGEPAYPFTLKGDTEILQTIRRNQRVTMSRIEDVETIARIALEAVDPQIPRRPQDATVMAHHLLTSFGDIPPKKKRRWPSRRSLMIAAGAMLSIALLVGMAVVGGAV